MPIIQIQILEGRSEETVEVLIENVTNSVSETLNTPTDNIRVIVTEVPNTHWGRAGKPMSKIKK
ncbi:4-oxalocrotonate tautomerase [Lysinibacillus sp. BW-2-10]|uniref:4-oxalocrotonate tautomerase n=1 Tax=Lysinibacillus sp. BW-2-10 TaxID=2590030 RepID=UPI00117C30C4|nr:4-oxalocrotonate tautomerase [Lysinibacillus sp. BW-2-10]TSI08713.1 4-oxalocrotonate tautomerase [Lysinibacillus sp. BW-2-10]